MRAKRLGRAGAIGLLVSAACGDVYIDPEGDTFAPPKSDLDGSAVFPTEIPTSCPDDRPRENTSCSRIGSACEYGTSADRQCNATLVCVGGPRDGYWEPRPTTACFAQACPIGASVGSLDGQPCVLTGVDAGAPPAPSTTTDADEAVCNVGDGVCACTTGLDGPSLHPRRWVCRRPLAACPTERPLAGHSCAAPRFCDYGSCESKRSVAMECKNGVWTTGGASCP